MSEIKRIPINEFRDLGYLQEANRQFFHPHGLALEVVTEEDGSMHLGGIWDYRDDPEGMFYGLGGYGDSLEKARTVDAERLRHWRERLRLLDNEHALAQEGEDESLPPDWPDVEPLDWTYPEP